MLLRQLISKHLTYPTSNLINGSTQFPCKQWYYYLKKKLFTDIFEVSLEYSNYCERCHYAAFHIKQNMALSFNKDYLWEAHKSRRTYKPTIPIPSFNTDVINLQGMDRWLGSKPEIHSGFIGCHSNFSQIYLLLWPSSSLTLCPACIVIEIIISVW